jgi:ribose-phosphate pyrophosphokinase
MLNELASLGVHNIITFDAHDSRVSNAIPLSGFEDMKPTYQILKAMLNHINDLGIFDHRLAVVSPDESGISRAMYYASMLGVPLGTFYRKMDYDGKTEGSIPVISYEYLGESVEGKNIILVDDMIVTGDSILDVACELRSRKAGHIYIVSTYGLFTEGLDRFARAYEQGVIDLVFATNLIYRRPELLAAPWFVDVDMSKYVSLIVDALNHDASLSRLMDPTEKIRLLLEREQNLGTYFNDSSGEGGRSSI